MTGIPGSTRELINFSTHPGDTQRFNDDWSAIAAYVRAQGVDGLELLLGYEDPPDLPPGLIGAVHLPFWLTWLDIWYGRAQIPAASAEFIYWVYGGRTADDLIATQRQVWQYAARLNPAYMVFHVSHIEPAHAFTRQYPYTATEVCRATADLLNAVAATFPHGEPPVQIALENLWWPGLTFTDSAVAELLAARLAFTNWTFLLDTGHLMNTNPDLDDETEAIAYVLAMIAQLSPAVRARIECVHLNLSLSGAYQRAALRQGLPDDFATLDVPAQYSCARLHAAQIDRHDAFTHPDCGAILDALCPRFVTHEFLSRDQAEFDRKLTTQRGALHTWNEARRRYL
ncbi:MAG: hypothetical protein ACLFVO_24000 [Chloroflexaceae bacterium]